MLAPALDLSGGKPGFYAHASTDPLDYYDRLEITENVKDYVAEAEQEARDTPWRAASLLEWCGDALYSRHIPTASEHSHWASTESPHASAPDFMPIRRSNLLEGGIALEARAGSPKLEAALELRERYPRHVPHLILRSMTKLAALKEARGDFAGALQGYKAASQRGASRDGKAFPYDQDFIEAPSNAKIRKRLASGAHTVCHWSRRSRRMSRRVVIHTVALHPP